MNFGKNKIRIGYIRGCQILACLGFVASAVAHVSSLFGIPILTDAMVVILHMGFLVLGVSMAVTTSTAIIEAHITYKKYGRLVLPSRFSRLIWFVLFAYGFGTILVLIMMKFSGFVQQNEVHGRCLAIQVFSVAWMFFYLMEFYVFRATLRLVIKSSSDLI